jgi:hypothetical protein
MRHVILVAATAVLLSGAASAREPGIEIAMGPTSAAHFPTNQPRGNSSPDCTLPDAQCPPAHKTPRHLYRAHKPPRHTHFHD